MNLKELLNLLLQMHRRDGAFRQRDPRRGRDHPAEGGRNRKERHPRDPAETRNAAGGVEDPARRGRTRIQTNER